MTDVPFSADTFQDQMQDFIKKLDKVKTNAINNFQYLLDSFVEITALYPKYYLTYKIEMDNIMNSLMAAMDKNLNYIDKLDTITKQAEPLTKTGLMA